MPTSSHKPNLETISSVPDVLLQFVLPRERLGALRALVRFPAAVHGGVPLHLLLRPEPPLAHAALQGADRVLVAVGPLVVLNLWMNLASVQ